MNKSVVSDNKPLFRVKKSRAWELDFLRGLAVILMCFDHFMFDLKDFPFLSFWSVFGQSDFINGLGNFADGYWDSVLRFWGHYIFVFVFLFIVGTSCAFSRNNSQRGAKLGVVAMVFTGMCAVIKAIGIMDDGVVFGILHCIALSVLVAAAVDELTKFNKYVNIYAPLVIGAVILFVGISESFWITVYEPWDSINGGRVFNWDNVPKYILGTLGYGDDWFGLFPYVGCVLLGMYWGKAVYSARRSLLPALDGKWNKPVCFVGRHALIFYLAHQIVIAGLVLLLCVCAGYRM